MNSDVTDEEARVDGRHARRERGRIAVIDAMLELLREGGAPPDVEQLAARAGVSASSIFRYFGSVEDLQRHTFEGFLERYRPLLEAPLVAGHGLDARVRAFVTARVRFYEETAPILRVARVRALEHRQLAQNAADMKRLLSEQVETHFAAELDALMSRARADEVAMLIDSLTAPEAWDALVLIHERSSRQVRRSWEWAIHALVDRARADGSMPPPEA